MTLEASTQLGRYEIVAPLGAGGMGEVYRARDAGVGRDVAIKVLSQDAQGHGKRPQRDVHPYLVMRLIARGRRPP